MADNDIIKSYRALDDNFFKNYKGQLKSNWENQLKTTINPQGYRTFKNNGWNNHYTSTIFTKIFTRNSLEKKRIY